jgi:hypothetical protein
MMEARMPSPHPRSRARHPLALLALGALACHREVPGVVATCATPERDGILEGQAYTLAGPDADGLVGTTVASVGDLDGDGTEELAVAEWWPGDTSPPAGRVFVACGPVVGDMGLGDACAIVQAPGATASFGHAVVGVGDWDGDAVGDLAVGDPGEPSARYEGTAYVMSGGAALGGTSTPLLTIEGAPGPGRAGFDLASADLDGDGWRELVVGSYRGAYGFSAGGAGVVSVEDADIGVVGAVLPFVEAADLDGDGHEDLVVPLSIPYGFAVYRGPFSATRASAAHDAWIDPGDRILPTLAIGGDLDGDALPDIVLGGSRLDSGTSDAGHVYVFAGAATGTISLADAAGLLVGETAGDEAGWSLSGVGDLTGDAVGDLLVGAIGVGGHGGVYVVPGPVVGETSLAEGGYLLAAGGPGLAGWSVAGLPPRDEEGCNGALIGAPNANAAFVFYPRWGP